MTKLKARLGFGLALLAGTGSLAGCISYAPQQQPPTTSSTTTESTTTQQPSPVPGLPGQTTTVTTTAPAPASSTGY